MRRNQLMQRTLVSRAVATAAVAVAVAIPVSSAFGSGGTLNGAGSSLVAPLVQTVFAPDFNKSTGNTVNYSSVGSSAGIAAATGRTVDFGASDAPLTSSQQSACNCVEIAWALSATGPAFNIPGVTKLNLSGKVLAAIYLGTITNWNDPAIKAINKGVTLPNLAISVAYRSDGSGDTYAFTNYLYHVSSDWRSKVGLGTQVSFPVGTGAKGNSGVAGVIASTPGAIGYVSTFYVRQTPSIHQASVQNLAGTFVYPYIQDITAAAALVTHVSPNAPISIVNPAWTKPKKGAKLTATEKLQQIAYPISTYTYALVPSNPKQSDLLKQFLTFAISPAEQKKGAPLVFAPLPKQAIAAAQKAISSL
jgi:phosphate transport system substrate-binding protein